MGGKQGTRIFIIYIVLLVELCPCTLMTSERGFKITDIFVPKIRLVGEDAELVCQFVRPTGVRVYSIKWWRDNDQFYQYIPRNDPPKLPFNVSGIVVDTARSSESSVKLRSVNVQTSGSFTCEVMADESFETVRQSKSMTVIDPPDGRGADNVGPYIEFGSGVSPTIPISLSPGRILEVECVAEKAYPEARLSWLINDKEPSDEQLDHVQAKREGIYSFTSKLKLTVTVSDDHFNDNGILLLVCNASIEDHYHSHATLQLNNPLRARAHNSGLFSAGFSINSSMQVLIVAVSSIVSLEFVYKPLCRQFLVSAMLFATLLMFSLAPPDDVLWSR